MLFKAHDSISLLPISSVVDWAYVLAEIVHFVEKKWMNKVFCCRAANARVQLFSEFKLSLCLQQDTLAAEQGASCY